MEIVYNNPYRIIGIYSGSSERELQKQKSLLNAYMDANKELHFDCDFPFLPNITRTQEIVEIALSNLQLNQKKLIYSLFWFVKGSYIDEQAFIYLQDGDVYKAEDIWEKVTSNYQKLQQNIISFNNLSTLELALACSNNNVNIDLYCKALKNKLELIQSDSFDKFVTITTDNNYHPDQNEIFSLFMDEIISFIESSETILGDNFIDFISKIFETFSHISSEAYNDIKSKLMSIALYPIEIEIKDTQKKRKANPREGKKYALNLYKKTKNDWTKLNYIFRDDLNFNNTSDNLAIEIMQCAIDCFNDYCNNPYYANSMNDEFSIGNSIIKLLDYSSYYAKNRSTLQRIEENKKIINEWLEETNVRIHIYPVKSDIDYILIKLNQFQYNFNIDTEINKGITYLKKNIIKEINCLWLDCRLKMQTIQDKLGNNDNIVINLNSNVINLVMGYLIDYLNYVCSLYQSQVEFGTSIIDQSTLIYAHQIAIDILTDATRYTVNNDLAQLLNTNLNQLKYNLNYFNNDKQNKSNSINIKYKDNNTGCYVIIIIFVIFIIILATR